MLAKIVFALTLAVTTVLAAPSNFLAARQDPDDSLCCTPGCVHCMLNSPCSPGPRKCNVVIPFTACCAVIKIKSADGVSNLDGSDGGYHYVNSAGEKVSLISDASEVVAE
ncbi:hypothetical protein QBC34DRAFT_431057 [Podospora aff. communis PSN243]|uniref:Uncharacterized protein n=1 Tax=Podospora aff. communis PSN243 TaxID=3040156 RepID=A0AAV9G4L5_9PEZI|nr:hypothetical protein QBC34DRAFT_431057 [Podospora aff. communis PSN243]